MEQTHRLCIAPLRFLCFLFLVAVPVLAQTAPIWTGSITCQLDDEEQGVYQRQEIQTWTLTSAPPDNPGSIPIYQATWQARAQGQLLRTQGTQTTGIQWVATVPAPGGQAPVVPIAIRVRGSDGQLVIGQWRAPTSAPNALNGQRLVSVNGVPQGQPAPFTRALQEWKFPLIEAPNDSTINGTGQTPADPGTSEIVHRYGGVVPPATCQWKLTKGTSGSQPGLIGTRPIAPSVASKPVAGVASGQQNVTSRATIALDSNTFSCGTNPAIGITGTLTHFVKDVTTVDFGPGILVDGVEVTSEGKLRVYPEILLSASAGTHPVTVTTNGEVVQLPAGLTVTSPCQALPTVPLQTVIPSRGKPGQQGLSVEITARDGHFKSGTTVADFGPGITVASLTINSPSSATAVINIDPAADNRTRTLSLTTNNNVASLTPGFIVQVPVYFKMNPQTGACGQNPDLTIVGYGTHFAQNVTTVDLGPGIVVDAVEVTSATVLHVYPEILLSASPGTHPVTVKTNDEVVQLAGGFTVSTPCQDLPRVPLQTVSPSEGQPGQQGISVAITARDAHFKQGTTVADFGPGITVASLTINSSSSATAVINIDPAADNRTRTLTLTTNNNLASLTPGFNVRVPVYFRMTPQTVACGDNPDFTIVGYGTHFVKDVTTVDLGQGIVVDGVTVSTPTKLDVYPEILHSANPGTRTVTVTTGAEVVHLNDGLTITSPCQALSNLPLRSVTPSSGQQGQQNLSVELLANHGFFKQGTTVADFGAGVTVASLTVNSSNDATALINIDSGASTGARTVRITTNNNSLTGGFTVAQASRAGIGTVGTKPVAGATATQLSQAQASSSASSSPQCSDPGGSPTSTTFGSPIVLGYLNPGQSTTTSGTLNSVSDRSYFRVTVRPGAVANISLNAGSDYDLYLYSSSHAITNCAATHSSNTENIQVQFDSSQTDTTVTVEVAAYKWTAGASNFTLGVSVENSGTASQLPSGVSNKIGYTPGTQSGSSSALSPSCADPGGSPTATTFGNPIVLGAIGQGESLSNAGTLASVADRRFYQVTLRPGSEANISLSSGSDYDLYLLSSPTSMIGCATTRGTAGENYVTHFGNSQSNTITIEVAAYTWNAAAANFNLTVAGVAANSSQTIAGLTAQPIAVLQTLQLKSQSSGSASSAGQSNSSQPATSQTGTSSSQAQHVPVSYLQDNVAGIWSAKQCTSCHYRGSGTSLNLADTSANTYKSIGAIQYNADNPSSHPLLTCSTNVNCVVNGGTQHPGGEGFSTTSAEYKLILQWIVDGMKP